MHRMRFYAHYNAIILNPSKHLKGSSPKENEETKIEKG